MLSFPSVIRELHRLITIPVSICFILCHKNIHPAYKMNFFKKIGLGLRMCLNAKRMSTGTSPKAHMVMALKLLEIPPRIEGDVIECGTWKGGSAVNLSIICKIVGRKLRIYDSFEGLPEGHPDDRVAQAHPSCKGAFCGTLEEVKSNISRYGEIECCDFIKGWYHETMPEMKGPVILAFLDVDLEASLDLCIRNIWPLLTEQGYVFIDEYLSLNYCSLFFSEKYWDKYFQRNPPGLIGTGTGLPLGEYYIGPWTVGTFGPNKLESPTGQAYTRKDFSAFWAFYPEESEESRF